MDHNPWVHHVALVVVSIFLVCFVYFCFAEEISKTSHHFIPKYLILHLKKNKTTCILEPKPSALLPYILTPNRTYLYMLSTCWTK